MSKRSSPPFSKIRIAKGLAFVSGELPLLSDGSVPEGIEAQTELVLERILHTLESMALDLSDVVSATIYLTHKEDFGLFNEVYARHFTGELPTRATVRADLMIPDARIEIAVIAATRN